MALLLHVPSGLRVALRARSVVGRSRVAHVQHSLPRVSGEHALIAWNGAGWECRDLGSRNGTWVDGAALAAGVRTPLRAGSILAFGDEADTWRLESDGEPGPFATDGERWIEGEPDLLGLPDLDAPEVLVEHGPSGWTLDGASARDGQIVEVGGSPWTLHLPEHLAATTEAPRALTIDDVTLEFRVSSDEEYVELTVRGPGLDQRLEARSHHELLLLLARQRLEDADDGATAAAEQGWMYGTDLERALRATSNQVYVSIHRARKELAALGVLDADRLVERRATTRQVRLGVGTIHVGSLA